MLIFPMVGISLGSPAQEPHDGQPLLGKTMIRDLFSNIMEELKSIFRDPGVLIIMGAAIVFYSFVYPLPYAREVLNQVPLTVIDKDNSALSRQLVRMVDASEMLRVEGHSRNLDRAQKEIGSGRYSAALVIPQGFEKDLLQGRQGICIGIRGRNLFFDLQTGHDRAG